MATAIKLQQDPVQVDWDPFNTKRQHHMKPMHLPTFTSQAQHANQGSIKVVKLEVPASTSHPMKEHFFKNLPKP